jgi:hypothetical protein
MVLWIGMLESEVDVVDACNDVPITHLVAPMPGQDAIPAGVIVTSVLHRWMSVVQTNFHLAAYQHLSCTAGTVTES